MLKNKMAVVDIETTGNAAKKGDRMIQIAIVVLENNEIVDQYSSFINPHQPIPPFIEELTGINDQMVKNAPSFHEIAREIVERLEGAVFVAHNVHFDLPFVQNELQESGYAEWKGPVIDTVELARVLLPTTDSFKLSDLTNQFALFHDRPHQADSDAWATACLLQHFIEKLEKLPLVTIEKMSQLSVHLKSDISQLLTSMIAVKRHAMPNLPPDIEVIRGIALKREDNMDVLSPSEHSLKRDWSALLEKAFPAYEKREAQLSMIHQVQSAIEHQRHLAIEAGTGVGKTMAYLLPAAFYAMQHKRVVVSTQTVQLQEQIIQKEAKWLNEIFHHKLQIALLKSRRHYLHIFKFEQSLAEEEAQYDVVLTKMQVLTWLTETTTGDVDELNLTSGGRLFWNRIRHDGWFLGEEKDPWKKRDFYLRAVNKANMAQIIVTNHAMLVHDAVRKQKLIPDHHLLIVDEAHHFEDTCRAQWGKQLDYMNLKYIIGQLGAPDQDLLVGRMNRLVKELALVEGIVHLSEDSIATVAAEADTSFQILTGLFRNFATIRQGRQKFSLSIDRDIVQTSEWRAATYAFERLLSSMKQIDRCLQANLDQVKKSNSRLTDYQKVLSEEIYSFLLEWSEWITAVRAFFLKQEDDVVVWLDGDLRSLPGSLSLTSRRIHVDQQMKEHFFSKESCVILTSATLTVNDSFDYFLNGLGIPLDLIDCSVQPSPFKYDKAVRLMVPKDLPDIKSVSQQEYIEMITDHLIAMGQATKGRMLVLFTSHEMLRNTYDLMKDSGLMEDFVLMAQGITTGSRSKLTRNFQRFDKAILFGTSSFWEGVDIPGEDLSCLVIVRLPFSPPDEPLTKAQSENVKKRGGNPFLSVSLPKAIIRFRQGFGRLIRHETDRGLIVVFDRRLLTTSYGSHFLSSIPDVRLEERDLNSIVDEIEQWL
ncbi:ATP-dependent DNA helicase DinG [Jeotgalibacillus soli]|uniref:3'-5' exonuclease DinG n=1 Tax=Jeotgalibacillus soli TaxID=889306 RepID=A0A0C2RQZ3_9BACL|nr:ATP-dependent DNA helicase DinG [Jeotgalibacillus soli]KIL44174.1 ATP-dependent DNA helicase/DNA polymerase III subunit epsilon [Jeotgalibacillus soli]